MSQLPLNPRRTSAAFSIREDLEFAAFVRVGMTPGKAIVAGTKRPAKAFGVYLREAWKSIARHCVRLGP